MKYTTPEQREKRIRSRAIHKGMRFKFPATIATENASIERSITERDSMGRRLKKRERNWLRKKLKSQEVTG